MQIICRLVITRFSCFRLGDGLSDAGKAGAGVAAGAAAASAVGGGLLAKHVYKKRKR